MHAVSNQVLDLQARLRISLGVCIGHAVDTSEASMVVDLPVVWQAALEKFVKQRANAGLYIDLPLLSDTAALQQTEVPFPDGAAHAWLSAITFKEASHAVQYLLHCIQHLRKAARTARQQQAVGSLFYTHECLVSMGVIQDDPDELSTQRTVRSSDSASLAALSRHNVLLRGALLVTKAATLAVGVRSIGDLTRSYSGRQALWRTVRQVSGQIEDKVLSANSMPLQQHSTSAEGGEAQHIASLLVEILLPALRQSLAAKDSYTSCSCCSMLKALMTSNGGSACQQIALQAADAIMRLGERCTCL